MTLRVFSVIRTQLRRGHKGFSLVILALGLAAMLLFASSQRIHSASATGEQSVLALSRLKTQLAIAHLWVKEYVDVDDSRPSLDQFVLLLNQLEEQTTGGHLLNRDEAAATRDRLAHLRVTLTRFVEISRLGIGGIDSSIDAQFDAVFAATLKDLRELETFLQPALDRNNTRSAYLVPITFVAWLMVVALAAGGLWRRDRQWSDIEKALVDSESRLLQAQKMDAVGRLAGGMAHDINNHLAAISMQCEVVKLKAAADDPIIGRMDSITAIIAKSADLIQRLLAFSRRQPVQPIVINVKRIVAGMENMLTRLIGEDIQLHVQCSDDVWNVLMDPSQLEQIIMNLIINARDAMPNGGDIKVTVENRWHDPQTDRADEIAPGEYLALSVSDEGTGIAPDLVDKIYEPFFTSKEMTSSSGLGLATVHGIVTQNQGRISFETEVGYGTTFEILLPRSLQAESRTNAPGAAQASQAMQSGKILLVEDNEELRKSTSEILGALGYTVTQASDGEHALRLLDEVDADFQLVITDVVMPGIGGKELADRIRERRATIPIVFVSGYTDDVVLNHGVSTGDVDFLAKPFSATDLANTIERVIGRSN